ncbi:MAG: hypothetical protein NC133_04215, partial [Prevotella sp.]|nr:hypothetical protein [Prevotella sp.]
FSTGKSGGGGSKGLNILYLDDICRQIDDEYYANHEYKERNQKYLRQQICKGNLKALRKLKPSALLLYVLRAKPKNNIYCTRLETDIRVAESNHIKGCCSVTVPFGSIRDDELDKIYSSTYSRIVKLSSLNRSYCLCDLNRWCEGYCAKEKTTSTVSWQTPNYPKYIFLSFDRSCNLNCKACRNERSDIDDITKQQVALVATKLQRSGYLEETDNLVMAGMGEVFYSPYYRQLLTTNLQRQQIEILSNGTLFNEDNWRLVAGKYKTIDVNISVDAATAETYQKLRGADFNNLMKNLTMLSDLHRKKQIRKYKLNFVVQRDNFREMPAFVQLGRSLGVDRVYFQRMNYFKNSVYTPQEFLDKCLIIDNQYLDYELWCVLQDPIFQDPIAYLKGLQRYISASEKRYRRRYEQEQKAKCSH